MKHQPGDRVIYRGIMPDRQGQVGTIAHCTGVHGLAAVQFDDGVLVGVDPRFVAAVEAEQLQEAA